MARKKKSPSISKDDAQEYTQSLGLIGGGWWRAVALAEKLGVPAALGMATKEWVDGHLGGYVKMASKERLAAIGELKVEGLSNVAIGRVLGVAESTVREDLSSRNREVENEKSNDVKEESDDISRNREPSPLDAVAALAATGEVRAAAEKRDGQLANLAPEMREAVEAKVAEGVGVMEAKRQVISQDKVRRQLAAPSGKYRIMYADPPWSYGNTQPDYHTEQRDHYPVMTLDEICDLEIGGVPVISKAEDDAILFLWVTTPILLEAFDVIETWGFEYKAQFIWDKIKHNMGHYNSVRHELLLICTRGSCQPDVRKLFDSVVSIERTEHSRKPEYFYEIIETLYPQGRRLEIFGRGAARSGWDIFGYEAEVASVEAAE